MTPPITTLGTGKPKGPADTGKTEPPLDVVLKTQVTTLRNGGAGAAKATERLLQLEPEGRAKATEQLAKVIFGEGKPYAPEKLAAALATEKTRPLAVAYVALRASNADDASMKAFGRDLSLMDGGAVTTLRTEMLALGKPGTVQADVSARVIGALAGDTELPPPAAQLVDKPVVANTRSAHPLAAKINAALQAKDPAKLAAVQKELEAIQDPGERRALMSTLLDAGVSPQTLLPMAGPNARTWIVTQLADRGQFTLFALPAKGASAELKAADEALAKSRLAQRELFKPGDHSAMMQALSGIENRRAAIATLKEGVQRAESQLTAAKTTLEAARGALEAKRAKAAPGSDEAAALDAAIAVVKTEEAGVAAELGAYGKGPLGQLVKSMEETTTLLENPPLPKEGDKAEPYTTALLAYHQKLSQAYANDQAAFARAADAATRPAGSRSLVSSQVLEAFAAHLGGVKSRGVTIDYAIVAMVTESARKKDVGFTGGGGGDRTSIQLAQRGDAYMVELFGAQDKPEAGRFNKLTDDDATKEIATLRGRRNEVQGRINGLTQEIALMNGELARVKAEIAKKGTPTDENGQLELAELRRQAMELTSRLDKEEGLPAQLTFLTATLGQYKNAEKTVSTRYEVLGTRLDAALKTAGLAGIDNPKDRSQILAGAKRLSELTGGPFAGVTAGGPFGEIEKEVTGVAKHAHEKRTQMHFSYIAPLLKDRFGTTVDPAMPPECNAMFKKEAWDKLKPADQQRIAATYDKWFAEAQPNALKKLRVMLDLQPTNAPMDEASLRDIYTLMNGGDKVDSSQLKSPFFTKFRAYLEDQAWMKPEDLDAIQKHIDKGGKAKISLGELRRIAGDPNEPVALRDAARKLSQNPTAFATLFSVSESASDATTITTGQMMTAFLRVKEYKSAGLGADKKPLPEGRVPIAYLKPGLAEKAAELFKNQPHVGTLVTDSEWLAWHRALAPMSAEEKIVLGMEFDRLAGKQGAFHENLYGFYGTARGQLLALYNTNETANTYAEKLLTGKKTDVRVPVFNEDLETMSIKEGDTVDPLAAKKGKDRLSDGELSFRFDTVLAKTKADEKFVNSGLYSVVNSDFIATYKSRVADAETAVAEYKALLAETPKPKPTDPRLEPARQKAAKALAIARIEYIGNRWNKVEGDASVSKFTRSVVMPVAVTAVVAVTVFTALPSGGGSVPVGAAGVAGAIAWGTATGLGTAAVITVAHHEMKGADASYKESKDIFSEGAFTAVTSAVSFAVPVAAFGRFGAWAGKGVGLARYMANPWVQKVATGAMMSATNMTMTAGQELVQHKLQEKGYLAKPQGEQPAMWKNMARAGIGGFVLGMVAGPLGKLAPIWARSADAAIGAGEAALFEVVVNKRTKLEEIFPVAFTGAMSGVVAGAAMSRYHARASFEQFNAKARIGADGDVIHVPPANGKGPAEGGFLIKGIRTDGQVEVYHPSAPKNVRLVPAADLLQLNPHIDTRASGTGKSVGSGEALKLGEALPDVQARLQAGRMVEVPGGKKGSEPGVVRFIDADTGHILIETASGMKRMTAAEVLRANPHILQGLPLQINGKTAHIIVDAKTNRAVTKRGSIAVSIDGKSVWVSAKQIAKQNRAALVPDIATAAAPPLQSGRKLTTLGQGPARDQSDAFNSTNRIGADQKIENGYTDGGRSMAEKGGQLRSPREILVVDATRDPALGAMMKNVETLRALPEAERAAALNKYVYEVMNGGSDNHGVMGRLFGWEHNFAGREVLLGEVPRLGGGACRHRALLYKVLADHVGLKTELVRGQADFGPNARGGHAWNEVILSDGSRVLVDPMNPKRDATGALDFSAKTIDQGVVDQYLGNKWGALYEVKNNGTGDLIGAKANAAAPSGGAVPSAGTVPKGKVVVERMPAAQTSPAQPAPPLAIGTKLTVEGKEMAFANIGPDGRLVCWEQSGKNLRLRRIELDALVKENPEIFNHVDLQWPIKDGATPVSGWRVSGQESGKVYLTLSDAQGNILQLRTVDSKQLALLNEPRLLRNAGPELAKTVILPAVQPKLATDVVPVAQRQAFETHGTSGKDLFAQVVADRQASLKLPEGNAARTRALDEIRFFSEIAAYTDGKTAAQFYKAWMAPGADHAFLSKVCAFNEPSMRRALAMYENPANRAFVQPRIEAMAAEFAPGKNASKLVLLERAVKQFGPNDSADAFVKAYWEAPKESTTRQVLGRISSIEDSSTARIAFKTLSMVDAAGEKTLLAALMSKNPYEGVRAIGRLQVVEARGKVGGLAAERVTPEIKDALLFGATSPRAEGVGPWLTPMQAGRGAEALMRMPAPEAKVIDAMLKAAGSSQEKALIMKAVAARAEVLANPAADMQTPRKVAVQELAEFAKDIRGRDPAMLAQMTSLESMRYDPASKGWVMEGGGQQVYTTSCGPTIALIDRANIDPITAFRYRKDPSLFAADQHDIMSRQGVRFEKKLEHMTPEYRAAQAFIDQKFTVIDNLRKDLVRKGQVADEERSVFKDWQGRRGGQRKGDDVIFESPQMFSLYQKMQQGLKKEGVNTYEEFCFFVMKSNVGTDVTGAKVRSEGTSIDGYLNETVGRYGGVTYDRTDLAAGGVAHHADAIELAVRNLTRVPIRVEWEPPGNGAHFMLISEAIRRTGADGVETRYFKIMDPETGKSCWVTDSMLAGNNVVGSLLGQGSIRNIYMPTEQAMVSAAPKAGPPSKPVAVAKGEIVPLASGAKAEAIPRGAPEVAPPVAVDPLMRFSQSPKDASVGNALAMRVDVYKLAEQLRGQGEVTVGGVSIQGFKKLNTPHEKGDAVLKGYFSELKALERQFPGLQFYGVGGKEAPFIYTGKDHAKLEATLRARFGKNEGTKDAYATRRNIAEKSGRADVATSDIEFYVGMTKPMSFAKDADPLAITRELVRTASVAAKQAQLTAELPAALKKDGREPTLADYADAPVSSFAVYNPKVVERLNKNPDMRNELNPFGLEVPDSVARLVKVGDPRKLSKADQIELLLCQNKGAPVGRAASDTFKGMMLEDVSNGVPRNRGKVAIEGGDELVVVATTQKNGEGQMVYIDLNAFGAINKITDYPHNGKWGEAVKKLRLERGQDPNLPITGADLGDAIKANIIKRLQAAGEKGGDMRPALQKLADEVRTEMRADPHLSVKDKVETPTFSGEFAPGNTVKFELGGRKLEGVVQKDGKIEVFDPAKPDNKKTVSYALTKKESGDVLRLSFEDSRPGLSISVLRIEKGDLVPGKLELQPELTDGVRGQNTEGFITSVADHYTEMQKSELKAATILGEPPPPLVKSMTLREARADRAAHWDDKINKTYARDEKPALDPMLAERAREMWEGGSP
ncbi:MAG: hypothetical protein IT381_23715 [Deltaproteobacteria bacterium]|nr:hypothetical protein [Deltaproteobacteria bacterium]